jgi:hypothetical protein
MACKGTYPVVYNLRVYQIHVGYINILTMMKGCFKMLSQSAYLIGLLK